NRFKKRLPSWRLKRLGEWKSSVRAREVIAKRDGHRPLQTELFRSCLIRNHGRRRGRNRKPSRDAVRGDSCFSATSLVKLFDRSLPNRSIAKFKEFRAILVAHEPGKTQRTMIRQILNLPSKSLRRLRLGEQLFDRALPLQLILKALQVSHLIPKHPSTEY